MAPQTFIFLGRSGCGKGTQAGLLKQWLAEQAPAVPCFHLEVGAKFRDFISQDSYTSRLSKTVNSAGGLQPEFLAVWAWGSLMIEGMRPDEHLIIDGTPRKLHEALVLDKALQFYGRTEVNFIFLDVSREWSRSRLLARKRADDTADDIEARLDWYDTDVVQAIAHFRKHKTCRFIQVAGEQAIEKVHAGIVAGMAKPAGRKSFLASLLS